MKKSTSIIALGVLAATLLGANTAFAFGGGGGHRFQGPRGGYGEGIVPAEMRAEWRQTAKAEFENLTAEERQAKFKQMREERKTIRQENGAAFENFTGLTREDIRTAHMNGKSMGDLLSEQGITEADAETFLTEQANERVDAIVEQHDLSAEEEQTLRDRIAEFVQNILDRWFGAN